MDVPSPEDDPGISAAIELLRGERPVLSFDEEQRLRRRLAATLRPPRRRRWLGRASSRMAILACLVPGALLTTAGTGLAIGGLATPGPAVNAQYPDSATGSPRVGDNHAVRGSKGARHPGSASLGQIAPSRPISLAHDSTLIHAETHGSLPFTGYDAIPVLLVGLGLVGVGAAVGRRDVRD